MQIMSYNYSSFHIVHISLCLCRLHNVKIGTEKHYYGRPLFLESATFRSEQKIWHKIISITMLPPPICMQLKACNRKLLKPLSQPMIPTATSAEG